MAADLPDLVDCARLGEEAAEFERVYQFAEFRRRRNCPKPRVLGAGRSADCRIY
jgi:hypothetical protein